MNKWLIYIVLGIMACISIFLLGYKTSVMWYEQHPITTVERDTITLRDTVRIEKPIPKYIVRTEEKVDTVMKYVHDRDTIEIPMEFPLVEKAYEDSTYKAVVKGVEFGSYPTLESLEIYQVTNYITETIKTRERANKWGLDINAGIGMSYDIYNHQFVPTIGVTFGIGYRLTK